MQVYYELKLDNAINSLVMENHNTQARDVLVPVQGEECVQFAFVGLMTCGDQNY